MASISTLSLLVFVSLYFGITKYINYHNSEEFIDVFNKAHSYIERNANFKIVFTDLSISVNKLLHAGKS